MQHHLDWHKYIYRLAYWPKCRLQLLENETPFSNQLSHLLTPLNIIKRHDTRLTQIKYQPRSSQRFSKPKLQALSYRFSKF